MMCCQSLNSAVNIVAIVSSVFHLFGAGLGYYVCTAIGSVERIGLEKEIYDKLMLLSRHGSFEDGDPDVIHDVIYPWAIAVSLLTGIMLISSLMVLYWNVRNSSVCLGIWIFFSIIDNIVSPITTAFYTYKFVVNRVFKAETKQEQKFLIGDITGFAFCIFAYYLANIIFIGLTWKRFLQITNDNSQEATDDDRAKVMSLRRKGTPRQSARESLGSIATELRRSTISQQSDFSDIPSGNYLDERAASRHSRHNDRRLTVCPEESTQESDTFGENESVHIDRKSISTEVVGYRNGCYDNLTVIPEVPRSEHGRSEDGAPPARRHHSPSRNDGKVYVNVPPAVTGLGRFSSMSREHLKKASASAKVASATEQEDGNDNRSNRRRSDEANNDRRKSAYFSGTHVLKIGYVIEGNPNKNQAKKK